MEVAFSGPFLRKLFHAQNCSPYDYDIRAPIHIVLFS